MQGPKLIKYTIALLSILTATGCSNKGGTQSLSEVQQIKGKYVRQSSEKSKHFREQAIQETAISTGAQAGLAWRTKQLNAALKKHAKTLDRVFNFQQMLLDDNILSPVLLKSEGNFNIGHEGDTLRLADKSYLILKQARFVTTVPNWRSYLWFEHSPPKIPVNALLPKTRNERKAWKAASTKGWNLGVKQADTMFTASLDRLKQDFQGMVTYKQLLAQNIVSTPHIAKTSLGVTGDDSEVRVNDQIYRIAALPALQLDSDTWKPILRQ